MKTIAMRGVTIFTLFLLKLTLLWIYSAFSIAENLRINILEPGSLSQWEKKSFKDWTQYQPQRLDNREVIKAQSNNAASGMVREIKIDLDKTPYLHWSWRVDKVLENVDETSKSGDDYPARIYVVISGGLFFWKTRALNYVWSNNQALMSSWPNAYTGNAVMLAVRSGNQQTQRWHHEKRNVLEDIRRYLQIDSRHIDAVAIMTDTDNSGQQATAYYGEIYFSNH